MPIDFNSIADQLISAGQTLHRLNMVPATSGNFSARLDAHTIAITVSGVHKGSLVPDDIMTVNMDGGINGNKKPSAETALHLQLYRLYPDVQCVLHPHSRCATLTRNIQLDRITLEGYELLKAFEGISTHESKIIVPIFENDQDIPRLAQVTGNHLEENPDTRAYIIRGHGFYTWGGSISTTLRHCEALEFLLQCEFESIREPLNKF
jgi:methylthioribulose-1-phosphate dehydratase